MFARAIHNDLVALLAALLVGLCGERQARAQVQTTPRPTDATASGSVSSQLWANAILDWNVAPPFLLELDLEPKIQVSEGPGWWALRATPAAEYHASSWLDLRFEIALGYTRQKPDLRSFEVNPRAGVRVFPLQMLGLPLPKSRLTVAIFSRIEHRSFEYFGSESEALGSSDWRFRSRIELRFGFDVARSEEKQPLYIMLDGEGFVPLDGRASERFASKLRLRWGVGYRLSHAHAIELLFINDWSRSTLHSAFESESQILDLRAKFYF